jgi:hypothetical protein
MDDILPQPDKEKRPYSWAWIRLDYLAIYSIIITVLFHTVQTKKGEVHE